MVWDAHTVVLIHQHELGFYDVNIWHKMRNTR